MWEKKNNNPQPGGPRATSAPPQQQPQTQPAAPPAQAKPAVPPQVMAAAAGGTTIGKAMTIIGEIQSQEDLYLDGEVQGLLLLGDHRLTVGPNGKVKCDIKAREVTVIGQVQGDVDAAQKVIIRKDGQVVGNIKTAGIMIDDEAYFKGSIDIVRK